jgi:hypothetical protein
LLKTGWLSFTSQLGSVSVITIFRVVSGAHLLSWYAEAKDSSTEHYLCASIHRSGMMHGYRDNFLVPMKKLKVNLPNMKQTSKLTIKVSTFIYVFYISFLF